MFIISISLGGPSTSSKRHLCRGKLQKMGGGTYWLVPHQILLLEDRNIFLINHLTNLQTKIFITKCYCWKTEIYFWQITWQFCKQKIFITKCCCSRTNKIVKKIFQLAGKTTHHQMLLAEKNIFVTKYSGLQSKIYFVTKYSGLQAKNWAGELISGQTRAGKILVKYTILDLLHMRKIGVEV